MTNPNPIKFSDLITPDNSINELIAQLTSLIAKYEELKTKISGSAGELSKSLKDISGATEAQREAIASLTTESEKLAKEYQNIDNLQKAATKETKKLTDAEKEKIKIDKLAKQAADAKDGSFNKLSAIYRLNKIRLNEMSEAERHGTEAGRQLERETKAIYEQMSNLQKATGKYTLEVGHYENALTRLPGPMGVIVEQFTKLRTTISGISSSSLPGGQKALLAFGAIAGGVAATVIGLAKSIATVIRTNAEFEQAVTNLSTIIGKSRKEMEALTDSALLLGRTTEYTASQVVQLQTNLAKLGFKDEAIIGMQRSVLQFATAVGANLEEAAYVAGATLRSFNLTSADTEDTLATLAVATNNSALSFYRIRESMGTVFPVANAFGLSVKDTAALLGTLADAGFDASMSATAVRNILIHLIKTDGDLAKSLDKPVKSFDDIIAGMKELRQQGINLGEVLELTDRRTVGPLNALMAGAERAEKLRDSLEDVDGELERIQKERLNTVQGSTLLLKSAWEGLELAFRNSNGTIKDTIDWLTKLTQKVQELLFPEQTAAQSFGDIYTEEFNKLIKDGISYENLTYRIQKRQQEFAEGVKQAYKRLQDASPFTAQKRRKEYDELLAMQQGYNKAAENAQKLWKNNEAEREQQLKLQKEAREKLLQELSEEDKKRIEEENKARIRELQAIVDSINFEIAATAEGTEAMLDARQRKVEAERNLELERNRQKVKTERKDEAIINAKFDADQIKVEQDHNKKVADLAVQRLQAEQQAIQLQLAVTEKGTKEELDLRLAAIKKAEEIEIEQNNAKAEAVRQSEDAIHAKYHKQYLDAEAKFYGDLAKRDLEASQKIAESKFNQERHNERERTIFRINQEIGRLKKLLELDEKFFKMLTEQEKKAIRENINELEGEKKRLGYDNIFELLGIDVDDEQQKSISQALDAAKELASSLVDMWKQAADEARSSADAQVEAAKKALEAEVEARRQGFASKEEEARKELALAKSTQAAAIEEQRKAQKAQESIDTLTQASSLVTASANLWKTLSELSPVAALAGIAVMWASFGASKIRAAQLTRSEQYGEGTVELLQGGSHASGHDIDLGTKRDGTKRRAEGGEYFAVINKRNSRKYGSLIPEVINSLNNGTFSERFARAGDQMAGAVLALGNTSADVSRLERDVKAIREQGAERRFTDGQGNTIIRYKNLTRKIKS